jgi:hypothetical protein
VRQIAGIATLGLLLVSLAAAFGGSAPTGVQFVDTTAAAGIRFRHNSGAFGKKYLPETMASGLVVFDFDGDGWQDLFFVNGKDWPGHPGAPSYPALYHNNQDGTFTDVTKAAGLAVQMYGIGGAAADIDNDGRIDLYVSCLGPNHLFRNLGGGKFEDVTVKAGVGDPGFSAGAAFFDYDRDGFVDLYVTNYVTWSVERDLFCTLDGKHKSYCTPESYQGQSGTLYHNRGNGTFEDVTAKAGVKNPSCKGLGVVVLDYNMDGWPDILEANDTQPNRLYRNNGNGTFTDVAVAAGVAFGETGMARAGMGVDVGDYAGDGRPSLVIGNFTNEMIGLYHNEGNGVFFDEAPRSGVGQASLMTLTFGAFFFDFDLDGRLDVFAAAGHVADDIAAVQPRVSYAQKAHLFRNLGQRRFEDLAPSLGAALAEPRVARGAVYLDYDGDGDLDIAMSTCNGPGVLLRNDGGNRNRALRLTLVGTRSNRDAIGARVVVVVNPTSKLTQTVRSGSSYCSQSELPLTFGLGQATGVQGIEVTWPTGQVERLPGVPADRALVIQEGRGIVSNGPLAKARRVGQS